MDKDIQVDAPHISPWPSAVAAVLLAWLRLVLKPYLLVPCARRWVCSTTSVSHAILAVAILQGCAPSLCTGLGGRGGKPPKVVCGVLKCITHVSGGWEPREYPQGLVPKIFVAAAPAFFFYGGWGCTGA